MSPNSLPAAETKLAFGSRDREQMEVGVPRDAHFQLARNDTTGSPSSRRNQLKPLLVLLFTRDRDFAKSVREALFGAGATVLIAEDVRDALQIVCQRGRELDFALMDFNDGCRGMTLLSAVHTCNEQLPVLVTMSNAAEQTTTAVAYANGARACLNKPIPPAQIVDVISGLSRRRLQLVAA